MRNLATIGRRVDLDAPANDDDVADVDEATVLPLDDLGPLADVAVGSSS